MTKTCMNCNYRNSPLTEYPCKYCDECRLWKPKECCSEFAIAEFEKIKAEIGKCSDYVITNHNNTEADMNKLDGIILATTIIDKKIAELKGENNGNS